MLLRKSFLASALVVALFLPHLLRWEAGIESAFEGNAIFDLVPKAHAAPIINSLESTAQRFFAGVLEVFTVLNWIALMGVQTLLDPDGIFGVPNSSGVRPIEVLLQGLWVLSRNIVNAIFAFILLAGGIYLIMGAGGEGMSKIKQAAPKFVLAVILVNFSWFFPRVILDAANILTSVVYEIPSFVGGPITCVREDPDGTPNTGDEVDCDFVWRVVLFPPTASECATPLPPPAPANTYHVGCPRPTKNGTHPNRGIQVANLVDVYYTEWASVAKNASFKIGTQTIPVSGASTVLNGLAVNFAKIPNFNVIDFQQAGGAPGTKTALEQAAAYLKFFVSLVLHAILSAAVGLALLAFLAVLVVRMVVLWLCIAFMPFIFVGYAMGKPLGDLGKEGAPNIWQKFLSYAFLPTLVAIPFAVGFTLVSRLYYVKALPDNFVDNVFFVKEIDSFHQLLWMLMSIGIIWFGVFAVLEKDNFAGGIVKTIKGIGTGGMKLAGLGAAYGLQVPLPGGRSFNLGQTVQGAKDLERNIKFPKPKEGSGAAADGGATTTPAPVIQGGVNKIDENQLNDLKRALGRVQNAKPGEEKDALAGVANELKKIQGLERDADNIVSNKEGLQNLLNSKDHNGARIVTEKESETILQKFENSRKAPGSAVVGTQNIGANFDKVRDGKIAQQNAAALAANALETIPGMSPQEAKRQIQNALDAAPLQIALEPGVKEVLSVLEGGGNLQELIKKLREIESSGSSPLPGDTSQIA